MTAPKNENTKIDWKSPTATVVALSGDVRGAVSMSTDEDFTGVPS